MSPPSEAPSGPPLLPAARSVAIQFERLPLGLAWGASCAVACGVLAAGPWPLAPTTLARVTAVWFVAVPLCGAVWAPFLGRRDTLVPAAEVPSEPPADAGALGRIAWRLRAAAGRLAAEHWDALLGLALAASVAALLGSAVLLVLAIVLSAFALVWLLGGRPPAARGAVRSGLEIAFPGTLAWLALAGPAGIPAPLAAGNSALENVAAWWQVNWLFPALLAVFTLIHYAMTAIHRRAELPHRRRQLGLGYLAAVAMLAVAGSPVGAGAVALLFVVQWPFESVFQTGRVRWHLGATQGFAMLAMLAAALAAGLAGDAGGP
jgi:hypothetical protein